MGWFGKEVWIDIQPELWWCLVFQVLGLTVTRGAALPIDGKLAQCHVEVCDDLEDRRRDLVQSRRKQTTNKKTHRRSKLLVTNDCHHKRALSDHVPAAWRLHPWWGCRWSAPPAPGPSCGPWSSRTEASGRRHSRRKVQSVSQWVSPAGAVSDCRGRSRTESSSTLYGSHSVFLCFFSVNNMQQQMLSHTSTLGRGLETADVWNVRLLCNWPHSLSPTRRNTTYDFFFSSGVDNMKI